MSMEYMPYNLVLPAWEAEKYSTKPRKFIKVNVSTLAFPNPVKALKSVIKSGLKATGLKDGLRAARRRVFGSPLKLRSPRRAGDDGANYVADWSDYEWDEQDPDWSNFQARWGGKAPKTPERQKQFKNDWSNFQANWPYTAPKTPERKAKYDKDWSNFVAKWPYKTPKTKYRSYAQKDEEYDWSNFQAKWGGKPPKTPERKRRYEYEYDWSNFQARWGGKPPKTPTKKAAYERDWSDFVAKWPYKTPKSKVRKNAAQKSPLKTLRRQTTAEWEEEARNFRLPGFKTPARLKPGYKSPVRKTGHKSPVQKKVAKPAAMKKVSKGLRRQTTAEWDAAARNFRAPGFKTPARLKRGYKSPIRSKPAPVAKVSKPRSMKKMRASAMKKMRASAAMKTRAMRKMSMRKMSMRKMSMGEKRSSVAKKTTKSATARVARLKAISAKQGAGQKLSKSDLDYLKIIFKAADTDNSGTLTLDEFRLAAKGGQGRGRLLTAHTGKVRRAVKAAKMAARKMKK